MRAWKKVAVVFGGLVLAAMACGPGNVATGEPKDVEQAVAATLTALAEESSAATLPVGESVTPVSPVPAGGAGTASPAILRVVYTDGGNAWILEGANPPLQLTASGLVEDVRISDDGLKVAFTRRPAPDSPVELRSVNHDATGEMVLLTPAQLDALYPLGDSLHTDLSQFDFVPGTHKLMFNTRGLFLGPGLAKHDNLLTVDADSAALTPIFSPGTGGDFSIAPNGARMAVVRPNAVDLANVDGSDHQIGLVTFAPIITYSEYQLYVTPIWRADSSQVGVLVPSPDPLTPPLSGTVWVIPSGGGPASPYPSITGQFFLFGVGSKPLLAPDLAHVAFTRPTATVNSWDLVIANPDGTAESLVDSADLQWAGWSPDGVHFVYSIGGPMNLHLGVLGGVSVPLAAGTNLTWIDSTDYLYLSGSAGAWTLNHASLGGAAVPLVSPAGSTVQFDADL